MHYRMPQYDCCIKDFLSSKDLGWWLRATCSLGSFAVSCLAVNIFQECPSEMQSNVAELVCVNISVGLQLLEFVNTRLPS